MTIPGEALPDGPDTDIEGDDPDEREERERRAVTEPPRQPPDRAS